MHSIGNDIVDLHLAKTQSNWQRKGFLQKQFTEEEQTVILTSKDPFLQVWLFWSMKEAAYKCYTQKYQKRFFAPQKILCKNLSNSEGIVTIGSEVYVITYSITADYIHSIAQKHMSEKMVSKIIFTKNGLSSTKIIAQSVLSHFSAEVSLKKNKIGIPYLYQQQHKMPNSITISHHGNYGAYAIMG